MKRRDQIKMSPEDQTEFLRAVGKVAGIQNFREGDKEIRLGGG